MQNNNCDGSHCLSDHGELRVLPTGGQSNAILCKNCYYNEIEWRSMRNKELEKSCQFRLPPWESLKTYITGE